MRRPQHSQHPSSWIAKLLFVDQKEVEAFWTDVKGLVSSVLSVVPLTKRKPRGGNSPPLHVWFGLACLLGLIIVLLTGVSGLAAKESGAPEGSKFTMKELSSSINYVEDVPDTPQHTGPVPKNDAWRSTFEARRLYRDFVKSGLVTFVDNACWGTSRDFYDQVKRPHTDRGAGRATYIRPEIWMQIYAIASDQKRRRAAKPYVEVTCLARAHSIMTASGGRSEHPVGAAADIGKIGGYKIGSPAQYYGDPVSQGIKALWAAGFYPCQAISHHGRGGISDVMNPAIYNNRCAGFGSKGAFFLSNHGDHLHIDIPR